MTTLKDIWQHKGLTAEELAVQADVSSKTVYRINKKEHVSPRSLRRVLKILDISIDDYRNLSKEGEP